jgi:hypothetical protein
MSSISAGTTSGTALVSTGDTSGALQLQVNGTTPSVTLAANGSLGVGSTPAYGNSGQVLTSAGSAAAPTWSTVSAGFTLGTPVATTSGTSIDFTGIPAGVKQIVISFKGVSTSNIARKLILIGDSGGIETADYESVSHALVSTTVSANTSTAGFVINSIDGTDTLGGSVTLILENATTNTWAVWGAVSTRNPDASTYMTSGTKSLSAVLDRVRITTVAGTNTFTAGEINIAYI